MLTVKFMLQQLPISLGVDTGASVTLLSESAYSILKVKLPNLPLELQHSNVTLSSVQGSPLKVTGTLTLPISLAPSSEVFNIQFYVTPEFALPCDGLLGLDSLIAHDISVHPKRRAIFAGECFHPAMDVNFPFLSSIASTSLDDKASHTPVSSAPLPCSPEEKSSSSAPKLISAIVVGDQHIGPTSATRLPVRLANAPVGSLVISTPESMRVHRLSLESTLSLVRTDHISDALVTNTTGAPITLKNGVLLGTFETLDLSSIEESLPLPVAGINATSSDMTDLTDVVAQLRPHVHISDYPEAKPALLQLLAQHRPAIALSGEPLGVTNKVTHHIALQPGTHPSYVPSYRLPHSQRLLVQQKVDELLQEGVIQQSFSPWNSPLFLVPKKDGSYRPVIDFRKVNAVTVPDHYPLPVLSELLQSIGKNNTVFTSLDLLSGFWQIPLDEKSREITAFSTPTGHYEWLRLPMGLRNAPLTFQRMVNTLFSGTIGKGLFVYLDDLIIVSKDMDTHLQQLALVFQKLTQAGLKVKLAKCEFLKSRIEFLGHLVDGDGIHIVDSKITVVKNLPTPTSVDHVCSFLGLAGYYRAFVKDFASIASPLTRLLKKDVPFLWNDAQQNSFTQLKQALTQAPVLAFPDYALPFTMCTDASALGVGAVLMQAEEGKRPHAIAYASRVLNSAESKYSVTHLEALAVVWALKHFKDIIFGYPITVYTDHVAVTHLFQGRNLTGRLARWYLTIQQFEPTLKFLPGKANSVADALSRNIPVAAVTPIANFTSADLSKAQRQDPLWSKVIYALESGDDSTLPHMPVPLSGFLLREDVLCRMGTVAKATVTQLVIPTSLVGTVLQLLHDTPPAGHPGRDRTLSMARKKYYWPTMRLDIEQHIARCLSCAETKGTTQTAPILEYPLPAAPFDVVGIDLLQLPRSLQGSSYVLVCVDHFSRFTVLAPLPNKAATTVAHALVSHLICPHTTPRVLLSDNGTEFKNQILQDICSQFNIQQTFITAHHPASNGLVERTNRKILEILRHLAGRFHETWEDWLSHVAASINGSVNSSTGKTPHYILYGVEKRLPYDVLVHSPSPLYSLDDYSKLQLHCFQTIHSSVLDKLKVSREEMSQKQHSKATPVHLAVGDSVMKRAPLRTSKLNSKFSGPFLITAKCHGNKFKISNHVTNTSEVVHADCLKKVSDSVSLPAAPSSATSSPSIAPPPPTHSYWLRSHEQV